MGSPYLTAPATVRALSQLLPLGAWDNAAKVVTMPVANARSGMLLVTYTQGTNTGAATYPLVRVLGGPTATNLFTQPIDDASAPVNLGFGVGLQTDLRVAVKAFRDAMTLPQSWSVDLTYFLYVQFQFSEVNGGATPGSLLVQLVVEQDH